MAKSSADDKKNPVLYINVEIHQTVFNIVF